MEIRNAKITHISIAMENHCSLTFWLTLSGDGWSCEYGGYCIGSGSVEWEPEDITAKEKGLIAMMRIMGVVGVEKWEDLTGKYVRCKVGKLGDCVDEIGNIIENKWFNIKEFFEK